MAHVLTQAGLMEGVTDALNQEAVEKLSADEPIWLRERRAHAWDVYERTPMPTTRLEEWRYTDLRRKLDLDALHLSAAQTAPDDPSAWPEALRAAMDEDREASGHIVVIDGHVVHADIDPALAGKGVKLLSLHEAVESEPELLQEFLATDAVPPEEGKFAALNAALWNDGIFLYVPRGVRLEHPVRVTRWISEAGAARAHRGRSRQPGVLRRRGPVRRLRHPDLHVDSRRGHRPRWGADPVRGGPAPRSRHVLPVRAAHPGRP